jgi:hypothetical protein
MRPTQLQLRIASDSSIGIKLLYARKAELARGQGRGSYATR